MKSGSSSSPLLSLPGVEDCSFSFDAGAQRRTCHPPLAPTALLIKETDHAAHERTAVRDHDRSATGRQVRDTLNRRLPGQAPDSGDLKSAPLSATARLGPASGHLLPRPMLHRSHARFRPPALTEGAAVGLVLSPRFERSGPARRLAPDRSWRTLRDLCFSSGRPAQLTCANAWIQQRRIRRRRRTQRLCFRPGGGVRSGLSGATARHATGKRNASRTSASPLPAEWGSGCRRRRRLWERLTRRSP